MTTEIGSLIPISMAIADGDVWLSAIEVDGSNRTTFRVDKEGAIVERSPVSSNSLRVDRDNKSVWTVDKDRFLRLSAESGTIQIVESIPCLDNGTAFLWTY